MWYNHLMSNLSIGKNGEQIAKAYLEKQGYKILEMNKRFSNLCEIDIVALDKSTLVFCEVKTRKTNVCGSPFEAITKTKYEHIKKGLYFYKLENPQYKKYRIDAVSVLLKPELKVEHLKNVKV